MPIEIRQLVIRTTVIDEEPAATSPAAPNKPTGVKSDRSAIVAECVEQVMEILREERER
ncbi:MAG: DUF5908 family protein [Verrucomicrobiota bacterium]